MKLRYTVSHESRRKAIAFGPVSDKDNRVAPVAYSQMYGYWLDLYNDRNGYRAEFGPYLSDTEAKRTGDSLLAALEDRRQIMAAMEGER